MGGAAALPCRSAELWDITGEWNRIGVQYPLTRRGRQMEVSMRCSDIWRLSAGFIFAVVLALVPAVHAQAPASGSTGTEAIVPFKIDVPNAVLQDLKQRLAQARFAEDFGDAGWDYGTNPAYLKRLVEY